jgi:hypothetical protein
MVVSSMVADFETPRISDKDIEAIADDIAGELRKLVRPISRR